jgi:hypothetical protein
MSRDGFIVSTVAEWTRNELTVPVLSRRAAIGRELHQEKAIAWFEQ